MNLNEIGFAIEVEILSKNLKMGHKILEVPIGYYGRTYKEGKKIKQPTHFLYFIKFLNFQN